MRRLFGALFGGTFAIGMIGLYIGGFIGWCWWMWMAIHFGSFWMFVFGLAGPTGLIAALLGLWSLLFGIPLWLFHLVS
jgi:hypothetical protein